VTFARPKNMSNGATVPFFIRISSKSTVNRKAHDCRARFNLYKSVFSYTMRKKNYQVVLSRRFFSLNVILEKIP
jgi:hypothetical protein